jgi:hypothetical protein
LAGGDPYGLVGSGPSLGPLFEWGAWACDGVACAVYSIWTIGTNSPEKGRALLDESSRDPDLVLERSVEKAAIEVVVSSAFAAAPLGPRRLPTRGIPTPYGLAVQEQSTAALQVRNQIQQGASVFKGGILGRSETGASQFLATESPLNPGYAGRYGLPPGNSNFDFILGGCVRPGAPVITRSAPGIPPNPGGGIEGVVNSGDFIIDWFHMP